MTDPGVPVVSLARAERGDPAERDAVEAACRTSGFFLLADHGVPPGALAAIREVSARFFAEDESYKRAFHRPDTSRGYTPLGTESIAATAGAVTYPDLKEAFAVAGADIGPGGPGADLPPVSWPPRPAGFVTAWHDYYRGVRSLAPRVMRVLAQAMRVPAGFFAGAMARSTDFLRVIHYPAQHQPARPGQLRAGAHTDFGALTVLATDDAPGGLQIRRGDGTWLDVPYRAGTYVINIGDLMAYWTNGVWVSAVHRVVNPPAAVAGAAARQSVVFFHNPDVEAVVTPADPFRGPGRSVLPPVRVGDWIRAKTARQRLTLG